MGLQSMAKQHAALDYVKVVRAQLDEASRMLESDASCMHVMQQIQTIQCSLERASRVTLQHHIETCFSDAVLYGHAQAAIDELVDTVGSSPASTRLRARINATANSHKVVSNTRQLQVCTTLSLPGISSPTCKAAIERIVTPIAGVTTVRVDVATKTMTIVHDDRAPARRLMEAVEDHGYHVYDASMIAANTGGTHGSRDQGVAHDDAGRGPAATKRAPCTMPGRRDAPDAGLGFVDGDGI